MVKSHDLVAWLSDVDKEDVPYVGGKAANLGEMIQNKFPVPPGFVLTAYSYFDFLTYNKLNIKIKHLLGTINFDHPDSIQQVSHHIKKIITHSEIPSQTIKSVFNYYKQMSGAYQDALVAIRSSATSEDSKNASFAGQQETFLNVRGEATLMQKIKEGWASLFEPRALFYRHEKKINQVGAGISLVIQQMVESEVSGVMFTIDPVTNDTSKVVIEAIYGLGEYIVQGTVTPDHYEVNKSSLSFIDKHISEQQIALKKKGTENSQVSIPASARSEQKLPDHEIIELAKLGIAIENHYYFPQDIEWAKEKGKLFIVQTRPITTIPVKKSLLEQKNDAREKLLIKSDNKLLLTGDPASPGIASGPVRILHSTKEIGKLLYGEVLVAGQTNPDYVPAMKKSAAIITETGGRTSYAAIVSREFGIPAVVGAKGALKTLKEGWVVTVNGRTGEIYSGAIVAGLKRSLETESLLSIKTKTKLLVNLAEPENAFEIAKLSVDGVGLLRAEFMIAQIGIHPKKLIRNGKGKLLVEKLSKDIGEICKMFYPRPVLYRTTDFKTNEYRDLKGGKDYEPVEANPMIGYRGAFRYVHDADVFKLELEAIKFVRAKRGFTNLHIMIPFVRTVKELESVKKVMVSSGLPRSTSFKLYIMVEVPSNVILIEEFIKTGIDGVSIGSNDLTMLILGIDRDNSEMNYEFNERDEAVMWAFERVIKTCNVHGIASSICGQASSSYPDLVEKLVSWGISSISVSPDAIDDTRKTIYMAEKARMLD